MAISRGGRSAFGAPGIEPQWTHGGKGGVATAYAASTGNSDRYNSMASVGNPATILLVDDDEAIRRLIQRILQQQGFHVIEASDIPTRMMQSPRIGFRERDEMMITGVRPMQERDDVARAIGKPQPERVGVKSDLSRHVR